MDNNAAAANEWEIIQAAITAPSGLRTPDGVTITIRSIMLGLDAWTPQPRSGCPIERLERVVEVPVAGLESVTVGDILAVKRTTDAVGEWAVAEDGKVTLLLNGGDPTVTVDECAYVGGGRFAVKHVAASPITVPFSELAATLDVADESTEWIDTADIEADFLWRGPFEGAAWTWLSHPARDAVRDCFARYPLLCHTTAADAVSDILDPCRAGQPELMRNACGTLRAAVEAAVAGARTIDRRKQGTYQYLID